MVLRRNYGVLSYSKFYTILIAILACTQQTIASCMGCVELDEISFDKMIGHFKYSLVKFDIAFPYGPKHEIYGEFAKKYGPKIDDLLVSLVGVKDYGEKENRILAQRYAVDEKAYPAIILFLDSDNQKYVKYPSDLEITVDNIKRFVTQHTHIYIPLEGCIEGFDKLARDFAQKTIGEQSEILDKAKEKLEELETETKQRAQVYVRFMEKVIEKGGSYQFILDERKRIEKLLKEKISDNKKKELTHKYNILQSFRIENNSEDKKDEL